MSSARSIAETGTSDANAFGQMEGPFAQGVVMQSPTAAGNDAESSAPRKLSKHSYEGTDPNIQKMLDKMFVDNFPRPGELRLLEVTYDDDHRDGARPHTRSRDRSPEPEACHRLVRS